MWFSPLINPQEVNIKKKNKDVKKLDFDVDRVDYRDAFKVNLPGDTTR